MSQPEPEVEHRSRTETEVLEGAIWPGPPPAGAVPMDPVDPTDHQAVIDHLRARVAAVYGIPPHAFEIVEDEDGFSIELTITADMCGWRED